MIDKLINAIKEDEKKRERLSEIFIERNIDSKTVLLNAGEIAGYVHFIKKGCVREWFNKDGKDITFQFFFEGQSVASIDSFVNATPSIFSIETIEPSTIVSIKKSDIENIFSSNPELKDKGCSLILR